MRDQVILLLILPPWNARKYQALSVQCVSTTIYFASRSRASIFCFLLNCLPTSSQSSVNAVAEEAHRLPAFIVPLSVMILSKLPVYFAFNAIVSGLQVNHCANAHTSRTTATTALTYAPVLDELLVRVPVAATLGSASEGEEVTGGPSLVAVGLESGGSPSTKAIVVAKLVLPPIGAPSV